MIAGHFLTLLSTVLASVKFANADLADGRSLESRAADPCTVIGNQTWVLPADVRACYKSYPMNETLRANIIDVVNKTLAFHTSVNYQKLAPWPFTLDVHEDLLKDFARIQQQQYASDYDLHLDVSLTLKRLNDGHCVYANYCYDSLFVNYLPTPLVVLTDEHGLQAIHIAPEAFSAVSTTLFQDAVQFWQDALPGDLKGQLESLSGAKVIAINGRDPWMAVDENAAVAGSFQGFGTRQNGFFASYSIGWAYNFGQFAQQSLPQTDSVDLTIQRVNSSKVETVTIPYYSRFVGSKGVRFNDTASFRAKNCMARAVTNGIDDYAQASSFSSAARANPADKFRQAPIPPAASTPGGKQELMNVMLDTAPLSDAALPPDLQPMGPLYGSSGDAQFFMLDDGKTGVLALGSFSWESVYNAQNILTRGFQSLQAANATQLIVDVSNNGGGYICLAHWLHRAIAGPKSTTEPQAGLDTEARAGPLAQLVAKAAADPKADPYGYLGLFSSASWSFADNTAMPDRYDWLQPPVEKRINGRADAFSQRLGQECQPFAVTPPDAPLFDASKVAIVGNGRCASSCAIFSITMAKLEGAKTVVVGGKQTVPQQYCGTVGGQSTDFTTVDTLVKTAQLKNNSLAPPDFLTNSVQGITFRLAFGVDQKDQPEEWQNHPADVNLPLTADIVNRPQAIWKKVAETVF